MLGINRALLSLQSTYTWLFGLDRTTSVESIDDFHGQASKKMAERNIKDCVQLNTLAVSPLYQRQGIGGALMDWGLQRAKKERVPVYLEATESGQGLYVQKGFEVVGLIVLPKRSFEGNGHMVHVEELRMPLMLLK
jgi:GNAT superfamily N-acetyltransferase